ncbi:MAG: beta-N-acetylglucosaminidase domain-containing protein, partial [Nitrososphaerota archaeon]
MLLTGIVEGFYGKQWSHKDRLEFIEFLYRYDFNTYIYAPKSDPFHRKKWYKPYPKKYLKEFYKIIKTCEDKGIFFIYALSPGLNIKYSSNEDFDRLINKYKQMLNLGIEYIGLFLDDIPLTLKYFEDKNRFKSLGNAHNYIAKKLFLELKKINPKIKLILCPTLYWGVLPKKYLIKLSSGLSKEIYIIWTGRYVVSPTITKEDAINFGKIINRKPFLWDNYPANDYNRGRLHLGPFQGRSAELIKYLSGYVANPMNEAEAS